MCLWSKKDLALGCGHQVIYNRHSDDINIFEPVGHALDKL